MFRVKRSGLVRPKVKFMFKTRNNPSQEDLFDKPKGELSKVKRKHFWGIRTKNRKTCRLLNFPQKVIDKIVQHLVPGDPIIADKCIQVPAVLQVCYRLRRFGSEAFFGSAIFVRTRSILDDDDKFRILNTKRTAFELLDISQRKCINTVVYVARRQPISWTLADSHLGYHDSVLRLPPGTVWAPAHKNGEQIWTNSLKEIRTDQRKNFFDTILEKYHTEARDVFDF